MSDLKDINIEFGKITLGDLLKELGIDLDGMSEGNDNDEGEGEFPKRGEEYWSIEGGLPEKYVNRNPYITGAAKMAGTVFKTEVEAKCFIGYLMARQDLINDTHGFKYDGRGEAYCVVYDYQKKKLEVYTAGKTAIAEIMFKTEEDAEKSIKEHGKEWEAYLGVSD